MHAKARRAGSGPLTAEESLRLLAEHRGLPNQTMEPTNSTTAGVARLGGLRLSVSRLLLKDSLPSPWAAYALGFVLVMLTLALRNLLHPSYEYPMHIVFVPAILATCLVGGRWPGLFATFVSGAGTWYFLPPPFFAGSPLSSPAALTLFTLAVTGAAVAAASDMLRHAFQQNEEAKTELAQALREAHRLSAIVESANDAIFAQTLDGIVTSCNRAAEEMFGYAAAELIGKPLAVLFPPDRLAEEAGMVAKMRAGERIGHYETVRVRKDGSLIDVSVALSPIRDGAGRITGVSKTVRDNTEKRRAEETLRTQAELLKQSFDAIIVWRLDNGIQSWNAGAQHLYGFSEAEALGRVTHDLLSTVFPKPWAEIRAELIEKGSWGGELHHRARDGKEVIVSTRLQLVRDGKGIERVLETNRDITEAKATEARLQALRDELARTARTQEMNQISAGLAHELNQPLTAILNYANVAKRISSRPVDAQNGRMQDVLGRVTEQATRAASVIQRMRSIVEQREADGGTAHINAIVEDAVKCAQLNGHLNGVTACLELSPDDPSVIVDRLQMQQVLQNLLRNAAEAMTDSPLQHVTVSTALAGEDSVEISVADTGPGIPQEAIGHLFQPFVTTKGERAGLGLVVSREIVEAHGGQLVLRNGESGGAVARIVLPAARSAQAG